VVTLPPYQHTTGRAPNHFRLALGELSNRQPAVAAPVPLFPRRSAGVFQRAALRYPSHMIRLDGPNILGAATALRPREIVIVIAIIVALWVVAAIVLL
jgi:hypothetical protein